MSSVPIDLEGGPADLLPKGRAFGHIVDVLRRDPLALVALIVIALWFLAAFLAPWIAPYPLQGAGKPSPDTLTLPPSSAHWMGTDNLGRDVWSRLLYGGKPTLIVPFFVVILAVLIGAPLGALAGYRGGWVDRVIMRVTDLFLAFPSLLLAMALTAALGPGLTCRGGPGTRGSSAALRRACGSGTSSTPRGRSGSGTGRSCSATSCRTR